MQLTQTPIIGDYFIKSYTPGNIQINDVHYHHSLLLSPTELIENWAPQTISTFKSQDLDQIIEMRPEVVLLGTGETQYFLDNKLLLPLIHKHIGFEIMNTAAACRTFNLLAGEGRHVVAALII